MNKQELIASLDKDKNKFIDVTTDTNLDASSRNIACGIFTGIIIAKNHIARLDEPNEPQVDKVEVPSMIAKFIKENSDPIFEICAWSDHYGSDGRTCDDPELSVVLDWYGSNTKEFYEAVLNGYTVKQEPKWVVKDSRSTAMYFNSVAGVSKDGEFGCGWSEITGCVKFTDKAKAEAVATLVDGSVEEV